MEPPQSQDSLCPPCASLKLQAVVFDADLVSRLVTFNLAQRYHCYIPVCTPVGPCHGHLFGELTRHIILQGDVRDVSANVAWHCRKVICGSVSKCLVQYLCHVIPWRRSPV